VKIHCKIVLVSILAWLLHLSPGHGQQDTAGSSRAIVLDLIYGAHVPGGDLKKRYGSNFHAGLGVSYISESGFSAGIRGSLLFGNQVKEDVLTSIRTPEGVLIGNDMEFASIFLRQRGLLIHLEIGQLLRLNPYKNLRSGIQVAGGIGTLIHRIRIVDDYDSAIQIAGPYRRGYDRLTMGFSMSQFAGYRHIDPEGLLNFSIGVEAIQGFTRSLRKTNYNSPAMDSDLRSDLLFGIRLAWLLPFQLGRHTIFY